MERENDVLFRISRLIVKEMTSGISPEEREILETWCHEDSENEILYRKLKDSHYLKGGVSRLASVDIRPSLADMQARISTYQKEVRIIWLRRVAGIVALFFVLFGAFWLYRRPSSTLQVEVAQQIQAGGPRAVLHLGNGTVIHLDTLQQTITQGEVSLYKTDDRRLAYSEQPSVKNKSLPGKVVYNEIEVPRGGEFDLVLSDGTVVWLNAESRLRYPVEFAGSERKVILEGEAYFQVKKNPNMPFRVESRDQIVEVLGTEFNISGYGNEENIYTTLVEGRVKVLTAGGDMTLVPGEQCILSGENGMMKKQQVDVEKVISWKKGRFILEEQNLEQIMQKLARWYDIAVFYQNAGLKNKVFKGSVPRYADLQQVLNILEKTGEVHFNIQNRTVIVRE